ncbi:MAG: SDR family NAD(P)-dependent oxidoreductase [Spirochaetales bacterium]
MLINLTGKVIIVTGAAAGIGRGLVERFAREGSVCVAIDRDAHALSELETVLRREGLEVHPVACDVTNKEHIQQTITTVSDMHGHIDVLINNAGVFSAGTVEKLSEADWDKNFAVNAKGTFLMSQAVIPAMKAQKWGRIINAASFAALIPSIATAAYAASKGSVGLLTRVMAGELGPWNITVNAYAPGMVPTGMNNFDTRSPAEQAKLLDLLSIRRWETVEDVANLLCFLASDQAGYITGTLIDVSGGKLATQIPSDAYQS